MTSRNGHPRITLTTAIPKAHYLTPSSTLDPYRTSSLSTRSLPLIPSPMLKSSTSLDKARIRLRSTLLVDEVQGVLSGRSSMGWMSTLSLRHHFRVYLLRCGP